MMADEMNGSHSTSAGKSMTEPKLQGMNDLHKIMKAANPHQDSKK